MIRQKSVPKRCHSVQEPRGDHDEHQRRGPQPAAALGPQPGPKIGAEQRGCSDHQRQEQRGDELRHEPEDESRRDRERLPSRAGAPRVVGPAEEVVDAGAVAGEKRRLHVVAAQPVLEQQRPVDEQHENGDEPAERPGEPAPEGEDVEERDAAEKRVPEPQAELVVGKKAEPDWRGDDPELERGLLEEGDVRAGNGRRREPVAGPENLVHREGVDRLVVAEVGCAEADEERNAEQEENQRDRCQLASASACRSNTGCGRLPRIHCRRDHHPPGRPAASAVSRRVYYCARPFARPSRPDSRVAPCSADASSRRTAGERVSACDTRSVSCQRSVSGRARPSPASRRAGCRW